MLSIEWGVHGAAIDMLGCGGPNVIVMNWKDETLA